MVGAAAMAMSTFCAFMGAVIYVPFFQALDKYIGAGRTLGAHSFAVETRAPDIT